MSPKEDLLVALTSDLLLYSFNLKKKVTVYFEKDSSWTQLSIVYNL
jgi:hypothetical protein